MDDSAPSEQDLGFNSITSNGRSCAVLQKTLAPAPVTRSFRQTDAGCPLRRTNALVSGTCQSVAPLPLSTKPPRRARSSLEIARNSSAAAAVGLSDGESPRPMIVESPLNSMLSLSTHHQDLLPFASVQTPSHSLVP